jgi:hypothetical protein
LDFLNETPTDIIFKRIPKLTKLSEKAVQSIGEALLVKDEGAIEKAAERVSEIVAAETKVFVEKNVLVAMLEGNFKGLDGTAIAKLDPTERAVAVRMSIWTYLQLKIDKLVDDNKERECVVIESLIREGTSVAQQANGEYMACMVQNAALTPDWPPQPRPIPVECLGKVERLNRANTTLQSLWDVHRAKGC